MKKICIFLVLIFVSSGIFITVAAENDVVEFTPGMEAVEIAPGISVLVPEGTDRQEHKGVVTFEDGNEYMVDRFLEIEERLGKLEKDVEELKKAQEKGKSEVLSSE